MLEGRTPFKAIMGNTPDISFICNFDFYEPVWYYKETSQFPEPKCHIARWLGEAHNIGHAMCYYIIPKSGIPIVRSMVQHIEESLRMTEEVKQELQAFDQNKEEKHGTFDTTKQDDLPDYFKGAADNREIDDDIETLHGNPAGEHNNNPIFDTRIYQVEFPDGYTEEFSANIIAECLYSQANHEGRQHLLLNEIIDYKVSLEVHDENALFQILHNGNPHPRRTTKSWCLCACWKDGSTTWEPLRTLKRLSLFKLWNLLYPKISIIA